VPLREWRIPTLTVLPEAAVFAAGEAAGEDAAPDVVEDGLPHDFNRMLPAAVEPRMINSRRPNDFVIGKNGLTQIMRLAKPNDAFRCKNAVYKCVQMRFA
jgi:hypothetical protein